MDGLHGLDLALVTDHVEVDSREEQEIVQTQNLSMVANIALEHLKIQPIVTHMSVLSMEDGPTGEHG